jgi:hypothetical protein
MRSCITQTFDRTNRSNMRQLVLWAARPSVTRIFWHRDVQPISMLPSSKPGRVCLARIETGVTPETTQSIATTRRAWQCVKRAPAENTFVLRRISGTCSSPEWLTRLHRQIEQAHRSASNRGRWGWLVLEPLSFSLLAI